MIKSIPTVKLHKGMKLYIPFRDGEPVLNDPQVGRKFVSFRTQYGRTRLLVGDEVVIEVADPCECEESDFAFNNVCRNCGKPLKVV